LLFQHFTISRLARPRRAVQDFAMLVGVGCGIWIPAARPDVLREDNVERLL